MVREARDGSLEKREFVPVSPRRQRFPPLSFVGKVKTTHYARVEVRRGVLVVFAGKRMPVRLVKVRGSRTEAQAVGLRPRPRPNKERFA